MQFITCGVTNDISAATDSSEIISIFCHNADVLIKEHFFLLLLMLKQMYSLIFFVETMMNLVAGVLEIENISIYVKKIQKKLNIF